MLDLVNCVEYTFLLPLDRTSVHQCIGGPKTQLFLMSASRKPGGGPGEVCPDLGLTPGQAYEV